MTTSQVSTGHHAAVFAWDHLPIDRPMEGIERRRIIGEKAMVSQVLLAKGVTVPSHAHENEQIAMLVSGKLVFTVGEPGTDAAVEHTMTAGQSLLLPANVPHGVVAVEESLVYDIFAPPSERTGIDDVPQQSA